MKILKIGGSIISEDTGELNHDRIESIVELVDSRDDISGIVVGGGSIAREYINSGKELKLDTNDLDNLGINVTHLNARLFQMLLDDFTFYKELNSIETSKVIMGGTDPGHTTDAVSIMLAETLGLNEVYAASDIDGLYDTRENKLENAEKLDVTTTDRVLEIVNSQSSFPGRNIPIDRNAVELIKSYEVKFNLFNGENVQDIESVLDGNRLGTLIK